MFAEETRLSLLVRPNDIDALGHVNNAVAMEYLEAGRADWLDRAGIVSGGGVIAVVARAEIDYRVEVPRGTVEVVTVMAEPDPTAFDPEGMNYLVRFRQRVLVPAAPRPAVEAVITVAFVESERRRIVTLQDYLAAAPAR
ncbi:acyl-CoA thioesterase [Frankia sp. AgB32]|uniref:acyl-CoA thioesterase n=1 Tax=Frankia sp. AgB32 TaxID=631119 RepID=UPI00200EA3D1|nr:acyl-CoA thioesterase [Frankia sp. AgB32]MCK9893938.1 acyl-CoA thioesterase [Frankia sp. AgB32]